MKRKSAIFVASLVGLSLVAGYLLSHISFVGRLGINLFYREYKFLKVWWKGTLLVLAVWLLLYVVHSIFSNKMNRSRFNLFTALSVFIAITGLCFSYSDFRNTLSHRWLGERFHLGVYLFWLGWIGIAFYVWLQKRTPLVKVYDEGQ